METDFNPYNFADPGNNDPRQKTEKNAVDGEKRNRGDTEKRYRESVKKGSLQKPRNQKRKYSGTDYPHLPPKSG